MAEKSNCRCGLIFAVLFLAVAAGADTVKFSKSGGMDITGDQAFIQVFLPGWKQVAQADKHTVMSESSVTAEGAKFTGDLIAEETKIHFEETVKKISERAWEVDLRLTPERQLYAYEINFMIPLSIQKYRGATLVIDGAPFRLPEKGEKAEYPKQRKVQRLVVANESGVYLLTGDFSLTVVSLEWGYQLRLHFKPGRGNFTSAALAFRLETGEEALTPAEKEFAKKRKSIVYKPDDHWKVVNTADIQVKPGSALDLSGLAGVTGKPAGKFGRVIARSDGRLAFERRSEESIRFLGFNWIYGKFVFDVKMSDEAAFKNIELFSDLVVRQGYNIIRLHCLDSGLMAGSTAGDFQVPEQNWRRFDHLVKCFKERGIYLYVDLAIVGYYNGGWTPSVQKRLRDRLYFEDGAREHWRTGVQMVLNHVNFYSGLALKDDPVVVCVLFYNEQDLSTMPWMGYHGKANLIWQQGFHRWLSRKYGTMEKVKAAWNDPETDRLKEIADIPFNGTERVPHGARRHDMSLYYRDLQNDLHTFYRKVIEECGYQGLTTQYDSTKNIRGTVLRTGADIVSMHDYGAHPSNSMRPGSVIGSGSTVAGTIWYWRSINQTRLLDKPMMVTEYAQGFWNPYAHEAGLAFPAYSAFQDYGAIMVHSDAVALEHNKPMDEFTHCLSPVFRANEFLAAHLFLRGDVKPARGLLEVKIDPEESFRDGNAEDALNSDQASLALVTGFGVSCSPAAAIVRKADLVMLPRRGGAQIVNTEYTSTVVDGNPDGRESNERILARLKEKGVIPPDNRTDFQRKIFESDTGELCMEAAKSRLSVTTGRTEAVAHMGKEPVDLSCLKNINSSVPALVAAVSVDGRPLGESRRIVLVYSTDAVNSGMTVSVDRSLLHKQGALPILMQCGKLKCSLKNPVPMELWALGLDGTKVERIPLEEHGGVKEIAVDTGKLKNGPAVFFELCAP